MTFFTFVTQSTDKVREAERILRLNLQHHSLDLPEIQSVEIEEVVTYKAKFAYEALGRVPVMIEDTGLFIEAWGGLPGALVKWFINHAGDSGICSMLHEFPNRSAVAKTIVATYDGQIQTFVGKVNGQIAHMPKGEGGFGWDRIFIPEGTTKTFGEMSAEEKDRYSMRRLALEAMLAHLS